jgi:hypothetical protein
MRNAELARPVSRGLSWRSMRVVAQAHTEPQGTRAVLEEPAIAEAHQLTRQLLRGQQQTQLRPDPRRLSTGERYTGNHRASL